MGGECLVPPDRLKLATTQPAWLILTVVLLIRIAYSQHLRNIYVAPRDARLKR